MDALVTTLIDQIRKAKEERVTELATHVEQVAKIRKAFLGWEDHGCFILTLDFDYGGSGQGLGGLCLDAPQHDSQGEFIGRFGTAVGTELIIRVLRACGVNEWSKLEGRTVYALRDEGYHGRIVGLKPLPMEKGKPVLFAEVFVEFGEAE